MTEEETERYLLLVTLLTSYDIKNKGVDVVSSGLMRKILKRLILRGHCVTCALCGKEISNARDLTLDHIVPRSCGGSDKLHNMQPAHKHCNELKGNKVSPDEIQAACADANDSPSEILERKKKRKAAGQKHRNVKRIKPWELNNGHNNSK